MDRVLVFTNIGSWSHMDRSIVKKEWRGAYPKEGGNQLVECLFASGLPASLQAVSDCRQEGVYLVFDQIELEHLTMIKRQCSDGGSLYVLYHSRTPKDRLDIILAGDCIAREGMHTNEPELLYYSLFKILVDEEDKKLEHVVALLKPNLTDIREMVSRFIMYSGNPIYYNEKLKATYKELCSSECVRKQVEALYELIDPENNQVTREDFPQKYAQMKEFLLLAVDDMA